MKRIGIVVIAIGLAGTVFAASPPDRIHYQGVLRDTSDAPLDGTQDMVFRFLSADTGGDEILIDTHDAAHADPVIVTQGLFSVELGAGAVADGAGPGSYVSLSEVFRDYGAVWLEVEIGGETLVPRVRVISAAYALNADVVDGKHASELIDISATSQTKSGQLSADASLLEGSIGVRGLGQSAGGYFEDSDDSGYARVGNADYGIYAGGNAIGGYFRDEDGSGQAFLGYGDRGISVWGNDAGGYFHDTDSSGYAKVASGDWGVICRGNDGGGYFYDADSSGYGYVGTGDYGFSGGGNDAGGWFRDEDDSAEAFVAEGHYGIKGYGDWAGGYFRNSNDSAYAYVGLSGTGIQAVGDYVGGYFLNTTSLTYAELAHELVGIIASGTEYGGYFLDSDDSSGAVVAYADRGIDASGSEVGGFFRDSDGSGSAYVGYGDRGIWGKGTFAGGTFSHPDNVTYWADVAQLRDSTTYKIRGTGTVSFVQNHPYEKDRLIVYAAPEGDEVAVYTRGSARLVGGEARIELGETFALVTNPDLGLTAHVTPRDEAIPLAVAGVSTSDLIVRGPAGSDAAFDYLVHGLRVGFEEHSPVQVRDREAFLPPREATQEFYTQHPELRRLNAFERFHEMRAALGESGELDLSRTEALVAAIDENRVEIVAAARARAEAEHAARPPLPERREGVEAVTETEVVGPAGAPPEAARGAASEQTDSEAISSATAELEAQTWLPVAEPVELGDVLALDPQQPGLVRRAAAMSDPNFIGIAAGPSRESGDGGLEAPMEDARYATVKVDAGYGEIRPGDLLVASPTPGHAMHALEVLPGTIIGKAIDPLAIGTGTIRVLVMLR